MKKFKLKVPIFKPLKEWFFFRGFLIFSERQSYTFSINS
jgi:uncharacterized protein YybS (DUF2232 family)